MHTLTDTKIRAVSANGKTQRLWDGGGLYLEVNPTGSKWWRLKYRHLRKEKRVSLGTYPTTSLKGARESAAAARKVLAAGVDVSAERKAVKQSAELAGTNSFEAIAREWIATVHSPKVCEAQSTRTIGRLERDVFPWMGTTNVNALRAPEI